MVLQISLMRKNRSNYSGKRVIRSGAWNNISQKVRPTITENRTIAWRSEVSFRFVRM